MTNTDPDIDIKKLLIKAKDSNVGKSTRRIFFNHLYQSVEERGYFHVDLMYGTGSGVLLKFDSRYFLLTAKHVISNNITDGFQNESPFWVSTHFKPKWQTFADFMFPRRIWNISIVLYSSTAAVVITQCGEGYLVKIGLAVGKNS